DRHGARPEPHLDRESLDHGFGGFALEDHVEAVLAVWARAEEVLALQMFGQMGERGLHRLAVVGLVAVHHHVLLCHVSSWAPSSVQALHHRPQTTSGWGRR